MEYGGAWIQPVRVVARLTGKNCHFSQQLVSGDVAVLDCARLELSFMVWLGNAAATHCRMDNSA